MRSRDLPRRGEGESCDCLLNDGDQEPSSATMTACRCAELVRRLGSERAQVHDGFVPSERMATAAGVAPVHVAGVAPVHVAVNP